MNLVVILFLVKMKMDVVLVILKEYVRNKIHVTILKLKIHHVAVYFFFVIPIHLVLLADNA